VQRGRGKEREKVSVLALEESSRKKIVLAICPTKKECVVEHVWEEKRRLEKRGSKSVARFSDVRKKRVNRRTYSQRRKLLSSGERGSPSILYQEGRVDLPRDKEESAFYKESSWTPLTGGLGPTREKEKKEEKGPWLCRQNGGGKYYPMR